MASGTMPTVSIILPCYNGERWLPETISSILAQTFQDFELIVVDDGSTDGTPAILESIAHEPRTTVIRQPNHGIPATHNRGLREAQGEFIAYIQQDDLWLPEKLALQVEAFRQSDPSVGLIYGQAYHIDEAGRIFKLQRPPEYPQHELLRHLIEDGGFVPIVTTLIRRACYERVGLHDESLYGCDDYDLWLRLAPHFAFLRLEEPLAKLRYHPGRASHDERMCLDRFTIAVKLQRLYPEMRNSMDRYLCRSHFDYGRFLVEHGRLREARQQFLQAVRHRPGWPYPYRHYLKSFFR
ncbi:MAG: glycosyltransferase [Candidatus Brocadiales bacterium]|nr:glycosyltransferase [Candidatus Bathyanammoxibius sp.]